MAAIALFGMLAQPLQVLAQASGGATNTGPIDIQADEQEFGEGHVVATGNVRVHYKDSIVLAPKATLYRDPAGQPQKAVFTGHPHLTQGANKIDADVLIFLIASQKIIADGHAHSEVLQDAPLGMSVDDGPEEDMTSATFGAKTAAKKPAASATGDATASADSKSKVAGKPAAGKVPSRPAMKNGQINWPTKAGDEALAANQEKEKPVAVAAKPKKVSSPIVPHTADVDYGDAAGGMSPQMTTEQLLAPPPTATTSGESAGGKTADAGKKAPAPAAKPPDKIITDSKYQEYNRDTGRFEARGDVHVKHGDIYVLSDRLQLVYGTDQKPESALFTGHVDATQNDNNTKADQMTYFLATQRLQATGNVRSKVIQKKPDGPKKGGPDGSQVAGGKNKTADAGKDKDKVADTTAFSSTSNKYTEPEMNDVESFSRPGAPGEKIASAKTGDKSGDKIADRASDKTTDKSSDKTADASGDKSATGKSGDKSKTADAKDKQKGMKFAMDGSSDEPMFIDSDAQDYNKDTGRLAAQGNVKVRYGEITGVGQNVLLVRNADGNAEKVIFTGRSQIIQPGKRWIGDKITMMVNDRRVIASGNTKAYILQTPGTESNSPFAGAGGKKPKTVSPDPVPTSPAAGASATAKADGKATASVNSNSATASSTNANPTDKTATSSSKISATKTGATD